MAATQTELSTSCSKDDITTDTYDITADTYDITTDTDDITTDTDDITTDTHISAAGITFKSLGSARSLVLIWVELESQFPVIPLDFFPVSVLTHSQYFVIVPASLYSVQKVKHHSIETIATTC